MWRGHACETDASIGKGISMSDHWCKGARYVRYATGGSGAYRTCAGLQRGASWASACLAGASRFEALLLNHRRRLPDAIVLVNAPHTLLSADNRRWAARACRRSAARPDLVGEFRLVSLECELDGRQNGTSRIRDHAVHRSFLCSLCLILLRGCAWAGWAVEVTALAARCRRGTLGTDYFCAR